MKPQSARRREVRKNIPRRASAFRAWVSRRDVMWGALYGLVFVVLGGLIVREGRMEPDYRVQQLVDRPVVSRAAFESVSPMRTEQAREDAESLTPAIYRPNASFLDEMRERLLRLPSTVQSVESLADAEPSLREEFAFTEQALATLKSHLREGESDTQEASAVWRANVEGLISNLVRGGATYDGRNLRRRAVLITEDRWQIERQLSAMMIRLAGEAPLVEPLVDKWALVSLADDDVGVVIQEMAEAFEPEVVPCLVSYFVKAEQEVYQWDEAATEEAKVAAREAVEPVTKRYEAGDILVDAGKVLDQDGYELLRREKQEYLRALTFAASEVEGEAPGAGAAAAATDWSAKRVVVETAPFVMLLLIALGLMAWAVAEYPRVAQNPMRGLAMTGLLLASLALAWGGSQVLPYLTMGAALMSTALVGVVIAIAYARRFAVGVTVLHGAVVALALNLTVAQLLLVLAVPLVAVVQLREVRHRGTLIRVGLSASFVAFAGAFVVGLVDHALIPGMMEALLYQSLGATVCTALVGFFVLGVLPFIEKAFRVTTSMTLLELCDVNQPLLRRLAQQAPGTYNHSLTVGVLAESAADSIGADGLLCRVGAYYHDIGKMNKPAYFVENQAGGPSRHGKLSPAMSLLVIVGHVKDGVEMAREYGLPRVLHHFIESHHGTTLVEYFYHAAKERAGENDAPSELEYRYPGPKPRTREAGILLLCDTIEGASRTMADPTPGRIEQLVHRMASKRLMDGQFDQCMLTLAELNAVERAITRSLAAIHHGRIAYPSDDKEVEEGDVPEDAAEGADDTDRVAG